MSEFVAQSITADDVLREARRYLGAPFRLYGRSVAGMDCIGLVVVVGQSLGQLPENLTLPAYAPNALRSFLPLLWEWMDEIEAADVTAGCGYLLSHHRNSARPRHLAISTSIGLVQMYHTGAVRKIAECGMDDSIRSLIVGGWKYKGLVTE